MIVLAIQLTLIALKLCGWTDASWLAVLSPLWVIALLLAAGLVMSWVLEPKEQTNG